MLTLVEGRAGAIARAIFRLRPAVLLLLAAALFAAAPLSLPNWPKTDAIVAATATTLLALLLSYVHLRHASLALLVALAPLCGGLLALSIGMPLRPDFLLLGYLAGLSAGIFIADALMGTVAAGLHRSDAARAAFAAYIPPALATLLFGLAPGIVFVLRDGAPLPAAAVSLLLMAPVATALLVIPFAGSYLRYGQTYLERASRLREQRQRFAEALAFFAEPRWALSLSGIAIVFAVLFRFGAGSADLPHWQILLTVCGLLLLCAILAARRWRAGTAITAMVTICAFAGEATAGRMALPLWSVLDILSAASVGAFLVCASVAWRFYLCERDGDEPDMSRIRGVTKLAPPLILSALCTAFILPLWYGQVNLLVLLSCLLAGHVAALLAVAALTGALETLMPRRRSLASLYRG